MLCHLNTEERLRILDKAVSLASLRSVEDQEKTIEALYKKMVELVTAD